MSKILNKKLEQHHLKVILSIKGRMREPHSLTELDARFLMKKLVLGEEDLFVGNTSWLCAKALYDSELVFHEYAPEAVYDLYQAKGTLVVTTRAIYLLSDLWQCVRKQDDFDGWDRGQQDSIRQWQIHLVKAEDKYPYFSVRKDRYEEFKEALAKLGKTELDPPTNPDFFDSNLKDPTGENSRTHLEMPIQKSLGRPMGGTERPRH